MKENINTKELLEELQKLNKNLSKSNNFKLENNKRKEGTIEKRGTNTFRLKFTYKGKPNTKTLHCTEEQAETELILFVNEIKKKYDEFQTTKYNFNKFATDEFLEKRVRRNLGHGTYDFYKYLIDSRLNPWFGSKDISKIKRSDIIDFLDNYSSELEYSTLKKYRNCLVTIFNYAIKKEYLKTNVAEKIDIPKGKVVEKPNNCYNYSQLQTLLKELNNEPEDKKMFVIIAMTTGLRREEICPLKIKHLDFENDVIIIEDAMIQSEEFGIEITEPKNEPSKRLVDIPKYLKNILIDYINTLPDERLFHILPDTMSSWFSKFIKRKGLPHITLHGLRHSYATYLLSKNIDLNTISTLLGHSSVITTGRIYINKNRENTKKAVSLIDF